MISVCFVPQSMKKSRVADVLLDSNTGSILFGGVDTEKYEGDLSVLPIQIDSQSGDISSFTIALSGITISNKAGKRQYSKTNLAIPVILDSGTTISYLPGTGLPSFLSITFFRISR